MGIPKYFLYLCRRSLLGILGLFAIIWLLVMAIDLIEAMREVSKVETAGMREAVLMTLFRTPQLILTLSPFIFLFGSLWTFGQMAKSSEVAVMRSAGLSVWRIVAAPVSLAVVLGLSIVMVLDPVAADMASRAQTIKNEMRGKEANLLRPFRDGIWLRQQDDKIASVIRAAHYDPKAQTLSDITVWRRTSDGVFIERWDAEQAEVTPTIFYLQDARRTTLHGDKETTVTVQPIPVKLDLRALREDVAKPTSLSVWRLPEFTRIMSSAGISTVQYEIRFHDLWSLPVKLMAMVLIGCTFSLGMSSRAGGMAGLMGIGIAAGFALFIVSELSSAVADAQIVPVALAAWAPGILAVLFAITILLYREDG